MITFFNSNLILHVKLNCMFRSEMQNPCSDTIKLNRTTSAHTVINSVSKCLHISVEGSRGYRSCSECYTCVCVWFGNRIRRVQVRSPPERPTDLQVNRTGKHSYSRDSPPPPQPLQPPPTPLHPATWETVVQGHGSLHTERVLAD